MVQPEAVLIFKGEKGVGFYLTQPVFEVAIRGIDIEATHPNLPTGLGSVGNRGVINQLRCGRILLRTQHIFKVPDVNRRFFGRRVLCANQGSSSEEH